MSKKIVETAWRKSKKGRKSLRELRDYHLVGESYIVEIERSKSNNSRCHRCGEKIGKNTLRGIQKKLFNGVKTFMMRFVHCSDCTIYLIEERIKELRLLKKMMKTRKRTREVSYKNQKGLQIKDKLLNELLDGDDKDKRFYRDG